MVPESDAVMRRCGRWCSLGIRLAALLVLAILCLTGLEQLALRDLLVDDTRFSGEIAAAAARHGLPPALVRAVVFQESRFDPAARGSKGEVGLMQVLPRGAVADWSRIHKHPVPSAAALCDPELNLEIGCWYLARAVAKWRNYSQRYELALAQYNAGGSRAEQWKPARLDGGVIDRITIASTREYVDKIMKRYRKYLDESKP